MNQEKLVQKFSKKTKAEKINWLIKHFLNQDETAQQTLADFWHCDEQKQKVLDGFSENTITNFPMPFGVAPNFIIDDKVYCVPMVIEESSVVAAAAAAAKFWSVRGGFKTTILGTKKIGQVHFKWSGDYEQLQSLFPELKKYLIEYVAPLTANMQKRGGGVLDMELLNFSDKEPDLYQIRASFETCDSMGANFINSVLEKFGQGLVQFVIEHPAIDAAHKDVLIIMAILSNFTPECIVRAEVSCAVDELGNFEGGISSELFAEKFRTAVKIAEIDPYRATTHNKGIYNGVDAVVLATANDFRAIEACGHTYASMNNSQYASLSHCTVIDGVFRFWIDLPLAVGTVGGLTNIHPLASLSLKMLGNPSAEELMSVFAATGLAQNFAALRSLVTTGIQKGHMKMHLLNILNHLNASPSQIEAAEKHFETRTVSFSSVRAFLASA